MSTLRGVTRIVILLGGALVLGGTALALWPELSLRGPIGGTQFTCGAGSHDVHITIAKGTRGVIRTRVRGPLESLRVSDGNGRRLAELGPGEMDLILPHGAEGALVFDLDSLPGSDAELVLDTIEQPAALLRLCALAPIASLVGALLLAIGIASRRRNA